MIRRTVPTEEGGLYYFDEAAADAAEAFFRERLVNYLVYFLRINLPV